MCFYLRFHYIAVHEILIIENIVCMSKCVHMHLFFFLIFLSLFFSLYNSFIACWLANAKNVDVKGFLLFREHYDIFFILIKKSSTGQLFSSNLLICFCWCRVSVPLILSLPATVLSLTKKDQLKVCHLLTVSYKF